MGVSVIDRSQQTVDSSRTGWFSKRFAKKPPDDDDDDTPQDCACHAPSTTRKVVVEIQEYTATLKQQRGHLVEKYVVYMDAIVALLAMLGFIIGSVFFIPFIEHNYAPAKHIGEYLFAIASVLILYLNVQDLCKVLKSSSSSLRNNENHKVVRVSEVTVTTRSLEDPYEQQHPETTRQQDDQRMDTLAAVLNSIGSLLFTIGSFLFFWFPLSGGWCFILGSASFVVGAFVHSFQIWTAPDRIAAQMATTMVLLETTGFTMFFVASLPYGFTFECTGDGLYTGAAVCYVLGSILCFVTCALDIRRLHYIKETQTFR